MVGRRQRHTSLQAFRDAAVRRHVHQPETVSHDDDVIVADVVVVEIVGVEQSAAERHSSSTARRPSFGDVDQAGGDSGPRRGLVCRREPHLLPVQPHGGPGRGGQTPRGGRPGVRDPDVPLARLQSGRVERERV